MCNYIYIYIYIYVNATNKNNNIINNEFTTGNTDTN